MKWSLLLLGVYSFDLSAHPVVIQREETPAEAYAVRQPPTALDEEAPPCPGSNYIWVRGHWHWQDNWVWGKGYWVTRPHPEATEESVVVEIQE